MVIFKGEQINHKWTRGVAPGTIYGISPQGWVDHELFVEWLIKLFVNSIPPLQPIILLLD